MHVSLDTADLDAAVAFYSRLFGQPPAKRRHDWAKLELDTPSLVLSLNAVGNALPRGRLSHLGVRLSGRDELEAVRARFSAAGLTMLEEPQSSCCYALQDKVWVEDPDGNVWEFYVLLQDVDAPSRGGSAVVADCCVDPAPGSERCC